MRSLRRVRPAPGIRPRETGVQAAGAHTKRNFLRAAGVMGAAMITGAIVFGMVGVAAGFTWDFFSSRGERGD